VRARPVCRGDWWGGSFGRERLVGATDGALTLHLNGKTPSAARGRRAAPSRCISTSRCLSPAGTKTDGDYGSHLDPYPPSVSRSGPNDPHPSARGRHKAPAPPVTHSSLPPDPAHSPPTPQRNATTRTSPRPRRPRRTPGAGAPRSHTRHCPRTPLVHHQRQSGTPYPERAPHPGARGGHQAPAPPGHTLVTAPEPRPLTTNARAERHNPNEPPPRRPRRTPGAGAPGHTLVTAPEPRSFTTNARAERHKPPARRPAHPRPSGTPQATGPLTPGAGPRRTAGRTAAAAGRRAAAPAGW